MSKRDSGRGRRRGGEISRGATLKRREEPDLEDLLREAEEALREADLPSGDWKAGEVPPQPRPAGPGERPSSPIPTLAATGSGAALTDLEGLDSEVAFWLLFPPRGNA